MAKVKLPLTRAREAWGFALALAGANPGLELSDLRNGYAVLEKQGRVTIRREDFDRWQPFSWNLWPRICEPVQMYTNELLILDDNKHTEVE